MPSDDEEIASLNVEYLGRWHVTRWASWFLCAALEPARGYRIVASDAGELAESIARYEQRGYLVR